MFLFFIYFSLRYFVDHPELKGIIEKSFDGNLFQEIASFLAYPLEIWTCKSLCLMKMEDTHYRKDDSALLIWNEDFKYG